MKILSVRSFADLKAAYGSTVEHMNLQFKEWLVDNGEALTGIDQMMWLDDTEEFSEDDLTRSNQTSSIPANRDDRPIISPRNLN